MRRTTVLYSLMITLVCLLAAMPYTADAKKKHAPKM